MSHSIQPELSDSDSDGAPSPPAAHSTGGRAIEAPRPRRRAAAAAAAAQHATTTGNNSSRGPPRGPPPPASRSRRQQQQPGASSKVVFGAVLAVAALVAAVAVAGGRSSGLLTGSSSSSAAGATPAAAAGGRLPVLGAGGVQQRRGFFPAPTSHAAARWLSALTGWRVQGGRQLSTAHSLGGGATPSSPTRSMHGGTSGGGDTRGGLGAPAAAAAATAGAGGSGSSSDGTSSSSSKEAARGVPGRITMYAVVDAGAASPFHSHSPQDRDKGAAADWTSTWGEVLAHMGRRLEWTDERFDLQIVSQDTLKESEDARAQLRAALSSSSTTTGPPLLFGIGVTDPSVAAFLADATAQLPTALFWDSVPALGAASRVDGFAPEAASPWARLLAQRVGFSKEARAASVLSTIDSLWGRHTSDDLLFIWLVLLNQYVIPGQVPLVANTTKGTDAKSLWCMIKNCGRQIADCVTDKTCKGGLDCLEGCAFNDQVCQYRCIVSYESPRFEQFALCILQLHNCRGLDAAVPMVPDPAPMAAWRGVPLTHEAAEDLFIGWMAQGPQLPSPDAPLKPYSWLVAAGKNPAYDAFGCQHQLYTRGRGKGQLWYEPVFRVSTLEGQDVWRRRRYRVRRGTTPGTFYYSVLDNGVTSNEYWRIVDCAEDLSYCLFYYSGAAAAAGLSYSGAVLGTPDGLWPAQHTGRIHDALRGAGIEPWELSIVDNSACAGAPLTVTGAAA